MDEPALYNRSGFHTSVLPILDREGAQSRVVIVKATYKLAIGQAPSLAEEQREVRLGDEPWGPPEIPDLRLPADYYAAKPGTDFVLSGHAVPPPNRASSYIDVGIGIAGRIKVLRVHGPRVWRRAVLNVVPGPSQLVKRTPLAWSLAYGGLDLTDPNNPVEEARNPVGRGIVRDVERLVGTLAPQIEAPDAPIGAAGQVSIPVGCAPLGRSFEPRRKAAGTYDANWIKTMYPARPPNYLEEHENFASPDLVFREPLRGGERVQVVGVRADGLLDFALPKVRVLIDANIDGSVLERRPHLDTVLIDSDALALELVWRTLYRCPAKMRNRFTAIRVQCKEFIA